MKKFSIIVLYYNQIKFIEECLKSIYQQSYKNIQIIIADDCSKDFDINYVNNVNKKYNRNNFELVIINSKTNNGTVKNTNNALKKVTGDFVMLLAADDKLYDRNVIHNFVNSFDKNNNRMVVTAQCAFYDEFLKKKLSVFVNVKKAFKSNKSSCLKQYEYMALGCYYASGATAYKMSLFDNIHGFDEKYKYVEDWSFWLFLLRNNIEIYYEDFCALSHRDGGISHSEYTPDTLPNHVRQYYNDIINIYLNEIFPYWDKFSIKMKYSILNVFKSTVNYYGSFAPEILVNNKVYNDIINNSKKIKLYIFLKDVLPCNLFNKIINLFKYNRAVPISFCLWTIICFMFSYLLPNINSNYTFLFYLLFYIPIYSIVYIFDKVFYYFNNVIRKGKK